MSTAAESPRHDARAVAERARWVEEAVRSLRMEGLDVTPEWEADAADVVSGAIAADEPVRRTRARLPRRTAHPAARRAVVPTTAPPTLTAPEQQVPTS